MESCGGESIMFYVQHNALCKKQTLIGMLRMLQTYRTIRAFMQVVVNGLTSQPHESGIKAH